MTLPQQAPGEPSAASGASASDAEPRPQRRWQGPALLLATVLAVVVAVVVLRPHSPGAAPSAVTSEAPIPQVGSQAPDFTATTLDGDTVSLHDLRGEPVWLVFGASWCAACRAEAPDVQTAARQAQEQGVHVVAIYVDEDAAAVRRYTERLGLTMTHVPDPGSRVADQYAARGVPAHFFLDRDGVVRRSIVGIVTPQTAADAIQAAR